MLSDLNNLLDLGQFQKDFDSGKYDNLLDTEQLNNKEKNKPKKQFFINQAAEDKIVYTFTIITCKNCKKEFKFLAEIFLKLGLDNKDNHLTKIDNSTKMIYNKLLKKSEKDSKIIEHFCSNSEFLKCQECI